MYNRFSVVFRAFVFGLAFIDSALSIVDETRITACTINSLERQDFDLDFEGFNSLEEVYVLDSEEIGLNCAHTVMNDDQRPKDQDAIDEIIESIGTIKTIDELDPT